MILSEFEAQAARYRRKKVLRTVISEMIALFIGIALLTSQYGWKTGIGLGLLAYVAMPIKQ